MKVKVKVDADSGTTYVALIDPSTNEHRKSATLSAGQSLELELGTVTNEGDVSFGTIETEGAEGGEQPEPAGDSDEQPEESAEPEAPTPEPESDPSADPLAGLAIGRVVIYRSKTGKYDLPAIVNCTTATLDPEGVQLGHVPQLDTPGNVHLTVFTCGKEGTSREGNVVNNEAAGGSYQEFNIPQASPGSTAEDVSPGTWRFPERV